jgi:hypothetical protein
MSMRVQLNLKTITLFKHQKPDKLKLVTVDPLQI